MLKNFLKIAFRNIKRNKGHSVINISGLAIKTAKTNPVEALRYE